MSGELLPLSSYALEVIPGLPTLAVQEDFPISIRITMAAIDPSEKDPDAEEDYSILRIIKRPQNFPEEGLEYSDEDEDEDEDEEDEDEDEEDEKVNGSKNEEDEDMDEDDDEDDEDDDEGDFDVEEFVICTLSPKTAFQQPLDIVITAEEQVLFEVTGPYAIHLTGNYIDHPYDGDSEDDDVDFSEDDLDSEDYDLSPDEYESRLVEVGENEDDDEEEDEEVEEEVKIEVKPTKKDKKEKKVKGSAEAAKEAAPTKDSKKRPSEDKAEVKAKKQKGEKAEDKKVAFSKDLELGPTGSSSSPKPQKSKKLDGGVTVEDRTVGEGPGAKAGKKVGVRYIGKLSNGKVFDSNTSGKPFFFTLGKGEVIKGWDVGVAGMAVKGERRIVIPAPMAYGKKALPGIPANSELTFDVKLVQIK